MEYIKTINGDCCSVTMHGSFTFADHLEFKNIFSIFKEKNIKSLIIDVKDIDFIDSAALGLLLLTKDEAETNSIHLSILKPQGQVEKMFKISKFDRIFNIIN